MCQRVNDNMCQHHVTGAVSLDDVEREQLKHKFAAKYLLQVVGGSHDENREWEVGHSHYDVDDERTLKR